MSACLATMTTPLSCESQTSVGIQISHLLLVLQVISDDVTETIGRAYFPLFLAKALTTGIVKEACKAVGISIPPKAGKNALLTHLGKQLFLADKDRLKTTKDRIARDDVILVKYVVLALCNYI